MTDIVLRTGPGQPTKLTPARTKIITDAVAVGMTWMMAAQYAGVSYSSLMQWKRFGQEAMAKIAALLDTMSPELWERIDRLDDEYRSDGEPTARDLELELMLPERERPYFRLWRGIERSIAFFELRNLTLIQQAAQGYDDDETVTVTRRDANGNLIETTTTRRQKRARSWQAGAWLLERRMPDRYSQVARHEHAGLGGGPIEVETVTAAEKLRNLSGHERDARSAEVLRILADAEAIDVEVLNDVVHTLPEPHGNGESPSGGSDDTEADFVYPDHPDAEADGVPPPG